MINIDPEPWELYPMERLQQTHDELIVQYDDAHSVLSAMLVVLRDDLLPRLVIEHTLPDQDVAWLSEWLSDIGSNLPYSYY